MTLISRLFRRISPSVAATISTGLALGIIASSLIIAIDASFGTSLPVRLSLAAAIVILVSESRWLVGIRKGTLYTIISLLMLACSTVLTPTLLSGLMRAIGAISTTSLLGPGILPFTLTAGFAIALILPAAGIAGVFAIGFGTEHGKTHSAIALATTGLGIFVNVLLLGPFLGTFYSSSIAALLLVATAVLVYFTENTASPVPQSHPAPRPLIESVLLSLLTGATLGLIFRLLDQFHAASAWTIHARWACLLLGAGLAWSRPRHITLRSFAAATIFAVAGLALFLAPQLTQFTLWSNATISNVPLLVLARLATIALILIPCGAAAAYLTPPPTAAPWHFRITFACGVIAFCIVPAALPPMFGLPLSLAIVLSVAGICAIAVQCRVQLQNPLPRWSLPALTALLLLASAAPFYQSRFSTAHNAATLFDSGVFFSYRNGTPLDKLTGTDHIELLGTIDGHTTSQTIWKRRGTQLIVRENGILRSVATTDPALFPRYAAEALPTILPLVVHDQPQSIMFLGGGSPTALESAIAFPIQQIVCAEPDPGRLALLQQFHRPETGIDLTSDDRLSTLPLDPPLAVMADGAHYDVIVSYPLDTSLERDAAALTAEFYRNAGRRLRPGGLFCQRIRYIDLGGDSLSTILVTFHTAFKHTVGLAVGPGELLLMGTDADSGFFRADIADRMQRPQVRETLASLGWDWVVPLSLGGVTGPEVAALEASPQTAADPCLTLASPFDVMRWADKGQEIRQALMKRETRAYLSSHLTEDGDSPEASREVAYRIGEVTTQRGLMQTLHDKWWAYRTAIKEQLSRHPRSVIQQVGHADIQRVMHPADQWRVDFVKALAAAGRQAEPARADIDRVAQFQHPFDPLVSHYIHEELAELHSRCPEYDPAAEFKHRLHSIHFGDQTDHGIHTVVKAINILVDHAPAQFTPATQRDNLCALLQILKNRWDLRRQINPETSDKALNDIRVSIEAVEKAFPRIDQLEQQLAPPNSNWLAEKHYIERQLLRPLRTYRTRLMPHHAQAKRFAAKKKQATQ